LLIIVPNVQECDATGDATSIAAGNLKIKTTISCAKPAGTKCETTIFAA
jgi:hypothetical protein